MPRGSSSGRRLPLVLALFASMLALVPIAGRAADVQLASAWRVDPIRIDGNDEEWRGRTVPVEGHRFSLGLLNDGDALYLCLTTTDRVLSTQIARQGLIVWLDPGAQRTKKHVFGVHFPIDPRLAAMHEPSGRWSGADPGQAAQAAIGILGPGKKASDDAQRVPMEQAGGIVANVGFRGNVLVYEMRVPLQGSGSPFAVAADPGGSIRLELETPEWRGPLPPSRSPIGIGVAAAAPGGRGVVGYPAMDATYLKPTDVKAMVRLASAR